MKSCTKAEMGPSPQGDKHKAAVLDVPQTGTHYSGQVKRGGGLPDALTPCKALAFVSENEPLAQTREAAG